MGPVFTSPNIVKGSIGEGEHKKQYTFYEVLNFCDMLQNGNPNMTELVVNANHIFVTDAWKVLAENKHKILTTNTIDRCIANAKFQGKNHKRVASHNSGDHLVNVCVDVIISNNQNLLKPTTQAEKILLMENNKGDFVQQQEANIFIDRWLINVRTFNFKSKNIL